MIKSINETSPDLFVIFIFGPGRVPSEGGEAGQSPVEEEHDGEETDEDQEEGRQGRQPRTPRRADVETTPGPSSGIPTQ